MQITIEKIVYPGRSLGRGEDGIATFTEGGLAGEIVELDIYKKKKTLPIICALEHASDKDRAKLLDIYSRKAITQAGVRQVIDILNRLHTEEHSRDMAQECYIAALEELGEADLSASTRKELKEVTDFLMDREY
jgi:geranylgeranyl pyrophosphate synthase